MSIARSIMWRRILLPALLVALCAALHAQAPQRTFAPYLDLGLSGIDIPSVQRESGVHWMTLGFLNSGGGCAIQWQARKPKDSEAIAAQTAEARRQGGHFILAFGGYTGTELALTCTDDNALANTYLEAARRFHAEVLDFDLEHFDSETPASLERRIRALKLVTQREPKLRVQFTFPASPQGLTQSALDVLAAAKRNRLPVAAVNVMAMDFAVPMPEGGMSHAAIAAADATRAQLRKLGVSARLGITPMIGMNDSPGETFTLKDAQAVVNYAMQHSDISLLAFWSLSRDHGGCNGLLCPTCSGVEQQDWQFSRIFRAFR